MVNIFLTDCGFFQYCSKDFKTRRVKSITLLAETISKENKQLDEDELNFVVQQTLDRIIFLRICEDRNIEHYGNS